MERLKTLFRRWSGEECQRCRQLSGGGSQRVYYRMEGASRSCVGTVAGDMRENRAFFAYTRHLYGRGMPVPELYAVDDDGLRYLQQDLGDRSLYSVLLDKRRQGVGFDAEMLSMYKQALTDLDALQRAGADMDFSVGYPRGAFDRRSMMWDLNYFKYFYLKLAHIPFDEELLENDFEMLADWLLEADTGYFLYRDFQGRNIMVGDRLYYIDYQGGRRGAAQYDVASLLYSAKSDLPEAVRGELLRHYTSIHGDSGFMRHFWGYAMLRILQTLGAYGYRGLYERKPYFAESIPLAVGNLRRLMDEHGVPEGLVELARCLERVCRADAGSVLKADRLTVSVMSFSYKKGLPNDSSGNGGGHIFDCRALPNPGRYEQYRAYTGRDECVAAFLSAQPEVGAFLEHARAIVAQSVKKYVERRFTHLQVAFGCTGGQHRSVYCAERTAEWLRSAFPDVDVVLVHREW